MRVLLLLCLLLCTVATCSWGQQQEIDSLTRLLQESKRDTNRVRLLLEIGRKYRQVDIAEAKKYADKAAQLAKQLNDRVGLASVISSYGTISFIKAEYDQAKRYYQQSLEQFTALKMLKDQADQFNNLGIIYEITKDFDQALMYHSKGLAIRKEIKDIEGVAETYHNLGVLYYYQSNFRKALQYYEKSLFFEKKIKNLRGQAQSLVNISNIHRHYGNYTLALAVLQEALSTFLTIGDNRGQGEIYDNIGEIYLDLKDFPKAQLYFHKQLGILQKVGDVEGITGALFNLGKLHLKQKRPDSTLFYFQKSIAIAEETKHLYFLGKNYQGLGEYHAAYNENEKAYQYFAESLAMKEQIKDQPGMINSLISMGNLDEKKQNLSKAIKCYKKALSIALTIQSVESLADIYYHLYTVYKKQGAYVQAIEHLERHEQVKDSLASVEKQKQLIAMEIKFETEQKTQEIRLLQQEKKLQTAQLNEETAQRNLLMIIAGALTIIALALFFIYRARLRAKEQINQKNAEMRQVQSRFFANVAHELRTPLTLITGPLKNSFTESEPLSDEEVAMMYRNAHRLQVLTTQLLDVAKLEAGKLPVQEQATILLPFLKRVTGVFSSLAEQKQINYQVTFIEETPLEVLIDQDKLEKIFNNLLSNALKFTPAGKNVSVYINVSQPASSPLFLHFFIKDEGPGIAPAEQSKIFDRFYQAKNQTPIGGAGIGLAFTKELVHLLGGKIRVDSTLGQGATFRVSLPLKVLVTPTTATVIATSADKPTLQATPASAVGSNNEEAPLLLIVEDDPDMRQYIKQCLGEAYRFIEATNGEEGILVATTEMPDVIISDLVMPFMDGLTFCQNIKTKSETAHIPFLLLTARDTQESKLEGLKNGADDYVTKPFDQQELSLRVKNMLEIRERLQEKIKASLLEPTKPSVATQEERFLLKVKDIIESYLNDPQLSVAFLSQEVGLSRVQLYRKVLSLTGMSVSDFIRSLRLKKAKQLLAQDWGNITEVAYETGFQSPSHFAKAFRKVYQQSPTQYLASLEGNT